jgi:hypothetical protein
MSATTRGRKPASSVEMLVLRDRLGYGRYRKTSRRDPEKRRLLLELGLEKIRKAERVNYALIGPRKRRFSLRPA